ncbi:MAG: hypothetical protein H8E15_14850 [Planctomycetes bacterium]|nr:hypothetical protein [Planctomycetota bacterium]
MANLDQVWSVTEVTYSAQQDAKSILNLHGQWQLEPTALPSDGYINALLIAGAKTEVLQNLQARLVQNPDDAYAEAVEVEVGCWDPATHAVAMADAGSWLIKYDNHPLKDYVKTRHTWLTTEIEHSWLVQGKETMARIYPALALLLAIGICFISFKILNKK